MYMGPYIRFCSQRATPGRILQVSTNLLQIQYQHFSLLFATGDALTFPWGCLLSFKEAHLKLTSLERKGRKTMRQEALAYNSLFSSLYAIQRHFYSQHSMKNILLKQSTKCCISFTGRHSDLLQ